jgi:predicted dehydrogenase
MKKLRFGIVGSGMIADVIARVIRRVDAAEVAAVASRTVSETQAFAQSHGIPFVFDRWQDLVSSDQIDCVYVATPTSVREAICIAAACQGKHVLAEKPFASVESLQRITQAARDNQVVFMDATHFVHNPRTHQIKASMRESIGEVKVLRCSFFVPSADRSNIRFDPLQEPMGVVGDLAWYCMRCVTEYLQPAADLATVAGHIVRDPLTAGAIRSAGVMVFEDGKAVTFNVGYDTGVLLTDLDIIGTNGMFQLNDFVMDRKHGFTTTHEDLAVGYNKRCGMRSSTEVQFIPANSDEPQTVHMIRNFVEMVKLPAGEQAKASIRITEQTQFLLDQFWHQVERSHV